MERLDNKKKTVVVLKSESLNTVGGIFQSNINLHLCEMKKFAKYVYSVIRINISRKKFIEQCQDIKQNWAGRENVNVCFCIVFNS